MKRPTRVTRGSFLVTALLGGRVGHVGIHRAELVDVDDLVVEAVPLLPEDHRALAVELDGDRGRQHHRREDDDAEQAEDDVEGALGDRIPVVDRLVENVEHRHRADVGIGARAEPQLVGVRRQPDVDRQHPELLQQRQHARLGGQRQRHDQHVDARDAGELDQLGDVAELGIAGHHRRRARCRRGRRRCRRCGCRCRAACSTERISASAALPPPTITARRSMRPLRAQRRIMPRQAPAEAEQQQEAGDEPAAEPHAREVGRDLHEEAGQRQQRRRCRTRPAGCGRDLDGAQQRRDLVAVGEFEQDHGQQRADQDDRRVMPDEVRREAEIDARRARCRTGTASRTRPAAARR